MDSSSAMHSRNSTPGGSAQAAGLADSSPLARETIGKLPLAGVTRTDPGPPWRNIPEAGGRLVCYSI